MGGERLRHQILGPDALHSGHPVAKPHAAPPQLPHFGQRIHSQPLDQFGELLLAEAFQGVQQVASMPPPECTAGQDHFFPTPTANQRRRSAVSPGGASIGGRDCP
jgi:hypothetical protein